MCDPLFGSWEGARERQRTDVLAAGPGVIVCAAQAKEADGLLQLGKEDALASLSRSSHLFPEREDYAVLRSRREMVDPKDCFSDYATPTFTMHLEPSRTPQHARCQSIKRDTKKQSCGYARKAHNLGRHSSSAARLAGVSQGMELEEVSFRQRGGLRKYRSR